MTPLPTVERIETDVLVVGAGTGGTAAAIAAASQGARVILAADGPWLGGMLTAAGVCAPDGNEIAALQTGLWGRFLQALQALEPRGLDHAWVSFFTYRPSTGAAIFADWARQTNITLLRPVVPVAVLRVGDRVAGVRLAYLDDRPHQLEISAAITIDATELGDLLALGDVPYRWGWEWQAEFDEPSAPAGPTPESDRFPVQSPTWVVYLRDFGPGSSAPEIPPSPNFNPNAYTGAWDKVGLETCLSYGQIPGAAFMLNWPHAGNDYAQGLDRLVGSPADRRAFDQEAIAHSQGFARVLQAALAEQTGDRRYGLATELFPATARSPGGAYALLPYYRESRRLVGLATVTERDILPVAGGWGAPLPRDPDTGASSAIAVGNYPNDHHYPGWDFPLAPKARHWGGRWTGTTFAIPYGALVPRAIDGLLVAEKNIAVSHIANGATRLQPVVLGIGQAAGTAAALCVARRLQPRGLPVADLQAALLYDPLAPAAVVPSFELTSDRPDWRDWQRRWSQSPEEYGEFLLGKAAIDLLPPLPSAAPVVSGWLERSAGGAYQLRGSQLGPTHLVTLHPWVDRALAELADGAPLRLQGRHNPAGKWLLVEALI